MKGFDFEEERIKHEINKYEAKRVLLQFPEGLKPQAPNIAKIVQETGAIPIISIDPCYGACDLPLCEAEELGVDLILHFGHSRMVKHAKIPVIYFEARSTVPIDVVISRTIPLLENYKKIGLATSVQHLQTLNKIREILTHENKIVLIGDSGKITYAGQVTGCNYTNAKAIADKIDAFLFVGGGLFHALGIALSTGKPTVIADPYDNRAFLVNPETDKILKRRFASIQQAKEANTFGILIGLKLGQKHLDRALKAKKIAEKRGKTAYLLAGREISPEVVLEFPNIDAYVNTACPRISLEATSKFTKPVLTIPEFMVALGDLSWERLLNDGLFVK